MMIVDLLKSGAVKVPWPTRLPDGAQLDGQLGVNEVCRNKCQTQRCLADRGTLIGTRCHMGLTVYEGRVADARIQVFGVVGPQHREALPRHVEFKQACKGRSVTAQEFSSWLSALKTLEETVKGVQERQLAEALEPLHDAMRLARDVEQLAEQELLEANPNASDRFAAASANQRALVKTASLLVDTFDLLEIYLNPQAAAFGQPRAVEVYKLLDKLAKIAGLARRQEQRPAVWLQGNTRRVFDVYESFKLIPLTLIDNAQKYSRKGCNVVVQVDETPIGLQVAVISEGAQLSGDEQTKIFKRGFRGQAAITMHPSGMGLGLYVAQTVALAHGSAIKVTSAPLDFEIAGIPQARNTFSFSVKNVVRRSLTR
jgi:signal transduction histidine kinase